MCELFDFETRKRDYDFFGCHAAAVATEWLALRSVSKGRGFKSQLCLLI